MSSKRMLMMMALSLNAACGGGGGSDDQAHSTGSDVTAVTATASTSDSGWLTVVVGGINPTPSASAYLRGRAFVSRLRSSCCTYGPADTGVSMSWQNLDTGETGTPAQHPGYGWALVWLLDKSGQNWDASIPLRVGSNTIVVTATDGLVVARQAVSVIRIVDDTPPVVTMTSPLDGAKGVSPASELAITFSEEVYSQTVSATTIFVTDAIGNRVDGRVSYAAGVATFTPLADLKENTTFTATVTTEVLDIADHPLAAAYVWTFTTGAAVDFVPPAVTAISPSDGAVCVPTEAALTAKFSKLVPNVGELNFVLRDGFAAPVAGRIRPDYAYESAVFRPDAPLANSTSYTAAITTDLMDRFGNHLQSDVNARFTTAPAGSGVWSPMSAAGAPTPRYGHSAVWTGTQWIVWGGWEAWGTALASGARYEPATDRWLPVSSVGAPEARGGHVALWTGSRMLVWSGVGLGYLTSGASYDPVTDTWSTLPTAGAPQGRTEAAAVWTGTEMIVWGGRGGWPYPDGLADGARYSPATNSWTPITAINAPSGRFLAAFAWTGNQLAVWGGGSGLTGGTVNAPFDISSGAIVTGTGGLYDPRADAWTPLSADGAPSARVGATAVWSGHELLVFGGYDEAALATGGRYDPTTNAWRAMSGTCAPLARFGHAAVWTGSAMLVWGGRDKEGSYYAIGGEYDPIADAWRQTGSGGVPAPRQYPAAAWTGTELVVWGGEAAGHTHLLESGGRYRP